MSSLHFLTYTRANIFHTHPHFVDIMSKYCKHFHIKDVSFKLLIPFYIPHIYLTSLTSFSFML